MNKQTCQFWHLQLQLFQLSPYNLVGMYYNLRYSSTYVFNKYTTKFDLKYIENSIDYNNFSENDSMCLATHLALQLSGIDE